MSHDDTSVGVFEVGAPPRTVMVEGDSPFGARVSVAEGNEFGIIDIEGVWRGGVTGIKFELGDKDGHGVGEIEVLIADDVVNIFHLVVPPKYRGEGAGATMFNIAVGVFLLSDAGTLKARVGGGEETAQFFESVGVPASSVGTSKQGDVSGFVVSRDEVLGWTHVKKLSRGEDIEQ